MNFYYYYKKYPIEVRTLFLILDMDFCKWKKKMIKMNNENLINIKEDTFNRSIFLNKDAKELVRYKKRSIKEKERPSARMLLKCYGLIIPRSKSYLNISSIT